MIFVPLRTTILQTVLGEPYSQNCASVQNPESGFDHLGYNCNDLAAHKHLSQYDALIDANYLQMISLELLRTLIG